MGGVGHNIRRTLGPASEIKELFNARETSVWYGECAASGRDVDTISNDHWAGRAWEGHVYKSSVESDSAFDRSPCPERAFVIRKASTVRRIMRTSRFSRTK